MSILGKLALLFIVVPLLELVLLVQMGRWVGLGPTLGLVVLTGVVGAWLARLEGMRTLLSFRAQVNHGAIPGEALMDGLCILVGGALLLTPGLLTDVLGFSLLIPPTRRWIQKRVRRRLERGFADGTVRMSGVHFSAGAQSHGAWSFGGPFSPQAEESEVIEVEVVDSTTDPLGSGHGDER